MDTYCSPTFYIDSDHPDIVEFSIEHTRDAKDDLEKAVQLYYAVRDKIRYNPYSIEPLKESMKASRILAKGEGYCVAKAVLLAACLRSQSIPARLGFADVKNHLTTGRLKEKMGTDLFVWHGYTDVFLNGKWVKATPAFNIELCNKLNLHVLDFDGTGDSIYHPFDLNGNRHMEYLNDRGDYDDVPIDEIIETFQKEYTVDESLEKSDFNADVEKEISV